MTTMTEALKKVGVTVSHNKRIWLWLKDHPGKTAKEIAAALNIPITVVYTVTGDMQKRKMLEVSKLTLSYNRGKLGPKEINTYTAVGREFELLPMPKRKEPVTQTKSVDLVPFKPVPEKPKKLDVQQMSVAEAKELYDQLRNIFG